MALRFLDSFDHYTNLAEKWTASTASIQNGTFRTGIQALSLTPTHNVSLTLDAQQTWIVGFAFNVSGAPNTNSALIQTLDGGTLQGELRLNSDMTFSLLNNTTVVATSTYAPLTNVWHYLEFKHTIASVGGLLEVRIDGAVIATFTGNTQHTGNATANSIQILNSGAGGTVYVDDLYILDGTGAAPNNAYWGDTQIQALVPNGAGNYTQWGTLVGAASHYAAVNEVPPNDDTSYVADATSGHNDSYTFQDLSILSGTINGIQVLMRAREDAAGGPQIKRLYRNAATDNLGAAVTLALSYQYFMEILATDPIAAAAWTVANVNSAEFGAQVV